MADPAWTAFGRAAAIPHTDEQLGQLAASLGFTLDDTRIVEATIMKDREIWKNSIYQVVVDRNPPVGEGWPAMIHLSIKRLDRDAIHDWRDLQRIKNELLGPEHEAVELYPAESRLVDTANQYHLWALKRAGVTFPFGWVIRLTSDAPTVGKARQRPR